MRQIVQRAVSVATRINHNHHHIILSLVFLIGILICNKNSFLASHGIWFCPLCCLVVMCLYCSVVLVYLLFVICYFVFFFSLTIIFNITYFWLVGRKTIYSLHETTVKSFFILWTNIWLELNVKNQMTTEIRIFHFYKAG